MGQAFKHPVPFLKMRRLFCCGMILTFNVYYNVFRPLNANQIEDSELTNEEIESLNVG